MMKTLLVNLACFLVAFISLTADADLLDIKRHEDILYLADDSSTEIKRFSLAEARFLPSFELSEAPTAMHLESDGIYVFADSKFIEVSLEGREFPTRFTYDGHVTEIVDIDFRRILLSTTEGLVLVSDHGYFRDEKNYTHAVSDVIYRGNRAAITCGKSVSPADRLHYKIKSTLEGHILEEINTQSHNYGYPGGEKCFLFPNKNRFIDSSGRVYDISDFTYVANFGGDFIDMDFWHDSPVILRNNSLFSYNKVMLESGSYQLKTNNAVRLSIFGDKVYLFSQARELVEVVDISVLSPAGPDASIDPTNLPFTPDKIALDKDGDTLYLLSKKHQIIFRWSVIQQNYLDSIPLYASPTDFSYSPELQRIYLSYGHLSQIRYIELQDSTEQSYKIQSWPDDNIVAADDKLIVFQNYSSGNRYLHIDSGPSSTGRGVKVDYNIQNLTWSGITNRVYFISENTDTHLNWRSVDTSYRMKIGHDEAGPSPTSNNWVGPIRVSENGKFVASASGMVVDGESMEDIARIGDGNFVDIHWMHGNLVTVRNSETEDHALVERWQVDHSLDTTSSYEVEGQAIGFVPIVGKNQLVLIYSQDDISKFEIVDVPPQDFDGDGYTDQIDLFPTDASRHEIIAQDFLPMDAGSTWYYDNVMSTPAVLEQATNIAGVTLKPIQFPSDSRLYFDVSNNHIKFYGFYLPEVTTNYGTFSADIKFDNGIELTSNSLVQGGGNANIQPTYGDKELSWNAETIFHGVDKVKVVAGEFYALHTEISFRGYVNVNGAQVYVVYNSHIWFGADVGIIKIIENGIESELTEYNIGKVDNNSIPDGDNNSSNSNSDNSGGGSFNFSILFLLFGIYYFRKYGGKPE